MLSYEEFRDQWIKQHPASVPKKPEIVSEYPTWVVVMVGAMFAAAAAISGVHTAPTVRLAIEASVAPLVADIAAGLSFVAVELALFVSAYLRHKNQGLAITILITTMIVAVSANIVSVTKALEDNEETGAGAVAIILGVAIPIITLAAGEMFVHITSAGRAERLAADRQYREDMKQIDAVILTAYRKYEKDVSYRVLSGQTDSGQTPRLSAGVLSDQTADRQTRPAPFGYDRTSDGQRRVIEYLSANPDDAKLPSRKLALRIEEVTGVTIGHDTANKGRNAWIAARAEQAAASTNGTGE